jgi:hypothetical protein
MLPGKGFWITICTGYNWNKDQTFQFLFQGFINIMCLRKSVMRIYIKINTYFFLEGGFEFCLKCLDKLTYLPVTFIVFLAVAYEDVVIISFNDA